MQLQAMLEAVLTSRRSPAAAARQARDLIDAITGKVTTAAGAPL
jgi:hypothetical protein